MPTIVTSADGEVAHIRVPGGFGLSAREDYPPDGTFRSIQVYSVDWAQRDDVILEAASAPYPHKPAANAWLYAANIRGYAKSGVSDGLVTYSKALVTLFFSTDAAQRTAGALFVTEELRGYSEILAVPTTGLRIGSTTGTRVPSNTQLRKPVACLRYVITFHHVLTPPSTIVAFKDYINSGVFSTYTLGLSFAPETVWYKDCFVHRTISLGGGADFMVQLEYIIRPDSWNKHWFPTQSPNWQYVYTSSSQVYFHPLGNINVVN